MPEMRECPNYLVINKGQRWTCDEIFDPDLYEMVIPLHEYSSQREDALRARIGELEAENASIRAWADACEKHGFRNEKELAELSERAVKLEDDWYEEMGELKAENSRLVGANGKMKKMIEEAYKEGYELASDFQIDEKELHSCWLESDSHKVVTATRNENDT